MVPLIKPNQTVLFQGDSITDCARDHGDINSLGVGYAMMAASLFQSIYPEYGIKFINKGISGNRAVDLRSRWTADCIDLKPDWVSILIGINDTWRRYDSNEATSVEAYKEHYQHILERTKNDLSANIVILEPFVLPYPADRIAWREDLDPKIQVARELAREFNALYVPYDGLFASASTKAPSEFWAADGVHPSSAGHAMMAREWLRAVSAIC